jgi:hypothetical protein
VDYFLYQDIALRDIPKEEVFMKKFILLAFALLTSYSSFAGGVTCQFCPAESNACAPRTDCGQDTNADKCFTGNCREIKVCDTTNPKRPICRTEIQCSGCTCGASACEELYSGSLFELI